MYKKKKKLHHKKKYLLNNKQLHTKILISNKTYHRQNFWQMFKFAIVGGIATVTHTGIFVLLIESHIATAMQANFLAFILAFLVSFLGQYHWTFKNSSNTHWTNKMTKFMIVALIGLGLNTLAIYIIVNQLHLSYQYAVVFMLTVVPVTTFIINKKWAFS